MPRENKPVRRTKGQWQTEWGWLAIPAFMFWKATGGRAWNAVKAVLPLGSWRHHPLPILVIAFLIWRFTVHPLAPLWTIAALIVGVGGAMIRHPDWYRRHVDPRIKGFFWGIKYRYELRDKLVGCRIIKENEDTPTPVSTTATSCTVTFTLKMVYGDAVEFYRHASTTLAPAFNALDVKVNPVRVPKLSGYRIRFTEGPPQLSFGIVTKPKQAAREILAHPPQLTHNGEMKDRPRYAELEFLARNPFTRSVGVEYINFQLGKLSFDQGDPQGPMRDGSPYLLDVATHLLNISMTGGGKTTAEYTMVYAGYRKVMAGVRENWGCDLARGVGLRPIAHCFTRIEDGKRGPEAVYEFWQDVRDIMLQRLDEMEEAGIVEFEVSKDHPELDVYFDEMAILESVPYADYRKAIYATMSEILVLSRKTKIRIKAFTQKTKLENNPLRNDFPETQLGRVKTRGQVRMAMDDDAYERGAKASDIPPDLPGLYYAEAEAAMAPIDFRFVETTVWDMQQLPHAPKSVLWHEPEPVEEVFVSLPVEAEPVPDVIPAIPVSRRLHMNSSRRPASTVRPSEPDGFDIYVPPPSTNGNGNGNGNGHHVEPERVEEDVLR